MREFTMRDAVNDYIEASGAIRPSIGGEVTILAQRNNCRQPTGDLLHLCFESGTYNIPTIFGKY